MHCDLIESLPHKTGLCCTLSAPQDKHTLQGAEQDIISRLTLEQIFVAFQFSRRRFRHQMVHPLVLM